MREKLIELLITAKDLIVLTRQAEFLIANGVTIPVRCKECKHYKPMKPYPSYNGHTNYCCRSANQRVSDDDFCSYGERRTE